MNEIKSNQKDKDKGQQQVNERRSSHTIVESKYSRKVLVQKDKIRLEISKNRFGNLPKIKGENNDMDSHKRESDPYQKDKDINKENTNYSTKSTKNISETNRHIALAQKTKLTLQFLQLLGEDFCTDFHEKIFLTTNPENKNEKPIFEHIIIFLKPILIFLFQSQDIEVELP